MVLKLYGHPQSTCTQRVAMVLHEKQVPFEFHLIDFAKREHKAPEFTKYQPFGQVPYIDDDGFILYESRAICHYLASKFPDQGTKGLVPTDPKGNALFQQAVSVEVSNFNDSASKLVYEKLFKSYHGGVTDQAVFENLLAALDAKLGIYDQILGRQKYLAGEDLTLADLYHIPHASMLPAAGAQHVLDNKPNVVRWLKDISSRPSWQAVKDGISSTA